MIRSAFAAAVSILALPLAWGEEVPGDELPRSLTADEAVEIERNPLTLQRSATDPPTGPLRTPAEYEPMEAVLLSYRGSSSWKATLDQLAKHITTTGDADVVAIVPWASAVNEAISNMTAVGADIARVTVLVQPTDSIWIRDYGPRYVYEGEVRIVVDHTYNRPRPLDNAIPEFLANHFKHGYYKKPLVHGGGNYHLDALGDTSSPAGGYTTRLINSENPDLTEQEIHDIWLAFKNLSTNFSNQFPSFVDATGHIDMWMQVVSDDTVVISEWPANLGSTQAQICDLAAADFAARGFNVTRIPARLVSGTHYTYTNVVIVNDLIIIPSYTNGTASQYNALALNRWQQAAPEKTIVQVNGQPLVTSAGVFHCVMMHVPAHLGGVSPTVYLRNLRGGEALTPGEIVTVQWISDAPLGTPANRADLLLSTNGGASFDFAIATNVPNNGSYEWTVPAIDTADARLRIVVRDTQSGNEGADESDANFTIGDPSPSAPGDLDSDGSVGVPDLLILLGAWGMCDDCVNCPADLDDDCTVGVPDLLVLLANWG